MTLNPIAKSVVAGATLLAAAGANLQPAHAALLNFTFQIQDGNNNPGTGSIIIESDVVDTNPDLFVSSFPGAVVRSQYTIGNNVFRNSQPTELITFPTTLANGQQVVQYLTYGDRFGAILNFNSANIPADVDILNDINSSPAVYQQAGVVPNIPPSIVVGGDFPGPNGSRIDQYGEDILDANVTGGLTATAVPEPSSAAGLVALGAMGAGSLLKRKIKRKVAA